MFNPIPYKPTGASELTLQRYLDDRVRSIREGLTRLHGNDGIIKWRKAYEAVPMMEKREFPWENASNLVIPVVAIHSDTLLARVLASVFKTKPLWISRELGEFAQSAPEGMRDAFEEWMQYLGLEPSELDLFRVYHEWFGESIRLGTSVVKTPWIRDFEDRYGPTGDGTGGFTWDRVTTYEGPRPEKLKFENFRCPVNKPTIEAMDFKYDVSQLSRMDLEERRYRGVYNSTAVSKVLEQPDRTSAPTQVDAQKYQDAKVRQIPGYGWAEWDICECHFKYRVDPSHYTRLIVTYHEKSRQILRSYYHYYPDEMYTAARLFYRDDQFFGMGFGEILLPFQEEISTIHNQRRDNMTVANSKMFAVDPDSKLHKGYRTFPSAMLPAKQTTGQKEIEPLEFGTPVQGEIDSERLSLELAEKRSGVSPPMQGAGAGTNTKRGIYTAMGTLSVMQEGNTRTDLNITDIKYAHTKLGRVLARQYAEFGPGDKRLERFGEAAEKIKAALDAIRADAMALPVYASNASVNREVEKQSDLMLTQVMERYHNSMAQMLQAVTNPMVPDELKKYTIDAMKSARELMATVLRHFGRDEIDRLLPKTPDAPPQQGGQPPQGGPQPPQGGGAPNPADLIRQLQNRPMLPPIVMPGGGGSVQ